MTRLVPFALALLLAAGPAAAGPLSDLIFAPGAAAGTAAEVSYAHARQVPAGLPEDAALPKPVSDEVLTLAQTDGEAPRGC